MDWRTGALPGRLFSPHPLSDRDAAGHRSRAPISLLGTPLFVFNFFPACHDVVALAPYGSFRGAYPTQVVPRSITLPTRESQHAFMLLENVLRKYLSRLYQGSKFFRATRFGSRATRIILIPRRRDEDLLGAIEQSVRERRMGDAVRLQYDSDLPAQSVAILVGEPELETEDLYPGTGFTAFTDLIQLYSAINAARLKDRLQLPVFVDACNRATDLWGAIRGGDVLAFYPYQSFDAVTHFVEEASKDRKCWPSR